MQPILQVYRTGCRGKGKIEGSFKCTHSIEQHRHYICTITSSWYRKIILEKSLFIELADLRPKTTPTTLF